MPHQPLSLPERLPPLQQLKLESCTDTHALFQTDQGMLEVSAYGRGILRLRLGDAQVNDYGLLHSDAEFSPVSCQETDAGYAVRFDQEQPLTLVINTNPISFTLCKGDQAVIEPSDDQHFVRRFRLPPLARTDNGWFVSFGLPFGSAVFGGGEKYSSLNRRGQLVNNWNEDALGVNSELVYKNCPFMWSPDGWGVFFNTPAQVFHGVGYPQWSNQSYAAEVCDAVLDMLLIAADTPAEILERYTHLTGRAPVVPRWSLGNWISKAYYRTPEEAMNAANTIREKQIPCDVLTLDGRAWQDTDTRFAFEWCKERYPDPKAFCDQLKALDYKICVWEYPLVSVLNPIHDQLAEKGYLLKDKAGDTYRYEWDLSPFGEVLTPLPASGLLDFTNPEAYTWWRNKHRALFEAGVDTIKSDFSEQVTDDMVASNGDTGDRLHNVYSLLYNLCVYEACQDFHGDQALVWGRAGWAGSQRAPIQWAGDSGTGWAPLAASILGGLSWGMSGVPYYSTDIGGFYGVEQPDPELFMRWTQAGVLGSHCRFHGIGDREPWHFGDEVEQIAKDWLALRYQLLPYLEKTSLQAHVTGLPMMRAMVVAFPEDKLSWGFETQYMLGDDLLVVPVVRKGGDVEYYLPEGEWFCFWSGNKVTGGRYVHEQVALDRVPLFVRSGAIIEFGPAVQHTAEITEQNRIERVRHYVDGAQDLAYAK